MPSHRWNLGGVPNAGREGTWAGLGVLITHSPITSMLGSTLPQISCASKPVSRKIVPFRANHHGPLSQSRLALQSQFHQGCILTPPGWLLRTLTSPPFQVILVFLVLAGRRGTWVRCTGSSGDTLERPTAACMQTTQGRGWTSWLTSSPASRPTQRTGALS